MAIGDSLFNGVRSLSIDGALAKWSAPAQLAKGLGITDFAVPDYPRYVVINMEDWVAKFPFNLPGLSNEILGNIAFWRGRPKSSRPRFDNIAIASSTYSDMWLQTPASAQRDIDRIMGEIDSGASSIFDNLGTLFFAFNTRFLLNPQGDPSLENKSSLDLVTDRQPDSLVVSIGANNGLWNMAFEAQACTGLGGTKGCFNQSDLNDLEELIGRLAALPVKQIYINALPYPSCTGVMMPCPPGAIANKPGPGKYFPTYENRFSLDTYATLTAAQVATNDDVVRQLNARVAQFAATADKKRIHVVPIDAAIAAYNWKNDPACQTIAGPDGHVISNEMIDDWWFGSDETWTGGIMGLDGMHPTIPGYNFMAKCILDTMAAVEGFVPGAGLPSIADAVAADSLISRLPLAWHDIMDIWRDIRIVSSGRPTPVAHPNASQVETLMKHIDFKLN
jgi:lysophospholipase L1-like esterase